MFQESNGEDWKPEKEYKYYDKFAREISQAQALKLMTNSKYYVVAKERVKEPSKIGYGTFIQDTLVSTCWSAYNYRFDPVLPPLIFETIIFSPKYVDFCKRYTTLHQAEQGHALIVDRLKAGLPPSDDPDDFKSLTSY